MKNGVRFRVDYPEESIITKDKAEALELFNNELVEESNAKYPIAFDFDGTITRYNNYPLCMEAREGIIDCIQMLHRLGYSIIIHTCRTTGDSAQNYAFIKMVNYLKKNEIPYDSINKSLSFQTSKPYAVLYIDDATLDWNPGTTGWELFIRIINYIKQIKPNNNIKNDISYPRKKATR